MIHVPTAFLLRNLKGLEIGRGSWNITPTNSLNVSPKMLEARQAAHTPIDIDAWADDIPVPDDSQDFVWSSHVVEHIPNLIGALREWHRVTRNRGYIVMIAPLPGAKEADKERPITTWDELVECDRVKHTIHTRPFTDYQGGHYNVFNATALCYCIDRFLNAEDLNWGLVGFEAIDSWNGNGFWLAYQVFK